MTKTTMAALLAGTTLMTTHAAAQVGATPVAPIEDAAPTPPGHAAATFILPSRDWKGGWTTPNGGLGADEAMWHLRVALNVAALGCRGAAGDQMVASYNTLLARHNAELATASAATEAAYKARFGGAWQQRHDDDMTKLYNFFAQPPAQDGFCAEASAVLRESASVEPAQFVRWSTESLRRLDAPFTSFYAAFDQYRTALARYAERRLPAAASPAMPVVVMAANYSPAMALAPVTSAARVAPVARVAAVVAAAAVVPVATGTGQAVKLAAFVPRHTMGPQE